MSHHHAPMEAAITKPDVVNACGPVAGVQDRPILIGRYLRTEQRPTKRINHCNNPFAILYTPFHRNGLIGR